MENNEIDTNVVDQEALEFENADPNAALSDTAVEEEPEEEEEEEEEEEPSEEETEEEDTAAEEEEKTDDDESEEEDDELGRKPDKSKKEEDSKPAEDEGVELSADQKEIVELKELIKKRDEFVDTYQPLLAEMDALGIRGFADKYDSAPNYEEEFRKKIIETLGIDWNAEDDFDSNQAAVPGTESYRYQELLDEYKDNKKSSSNGMKSVVELQQQRNKTWLDVDKAIKNKYNVSDKELDPLRKQAASMLQKYGDDALTLTAAIYEALSDAEFGLTNTVKKRQIEDKIIKNKLKSSPKSPNASKKETKKETDAYGGEDWEDIM